MPYRSRSAMSDAEGSGVLVLVGTPLGNRGDLSPRAREAILGADLLLCEDTRSPVRLLGDQAELPRRVSCFVGNEHERVQTLLAALEEGKRVVFVSEAGLPVWSDPGQVLVAAAVGAGHEVDVVPGPTAATVALVASGFAATGATFFGFLPRSGAERGSLLERIAVCEGPSILYEAGNRVGTTLRDLAGACDSPRAVLVARELTKAHQEFIRGDLEQLVARLGDPLRGEVTIVIDGAPSPVEGEDPAREAARATLELMLREDLRPRERAKALAELTGLDTREIYERLSRD